ncbi:MAG TPA: FAD/NAD(P)-binding oxidoreductase [Candidatus Baltobacteraceae bacterium]
MSLRSVVIVGASLAGLAAAHRLRDLAFDGTITIVGEEESPPYQRPPLSKQFLTGDWERPRLDLRIQRQDFDWRLGARATGLNVAERRVTLASGEHVPFDGLVIATGARARAPAGFAGRNGAYTLRTVEDASAIRDRIARGARKAVVVGAGFIGCEVASSLRKLGCDVTVVEMDRLPLLRVLGERLGEVCRTLHEAHGVKLELGIGVDGFAGSDAIEGVRLSDGRVIEAEIVIAGIGVTPNVGWLEDSGLDLQNGVLCDATGMAAENIVAAGDVARWDHPRYGPVRIEHWDSAIGQGEAAAATLISGRERAAAFDMTSFFWSDQYENKMQLVGMPQSPDELRVVEGALDERRFVAVFLRGGRVTGAFLYNSMHRVIAYKAMVDSNAHLEAKTA